MLHDQALKSDAALPNGITFSPSGYPYTPYYVRATRTRHATLEQAVSVRDRAASSSGPRVTVEVFLPTSPRGAYKAATLREREIRKAVRP